MTSTSRTHAAALLGALTVVGLAFAAGRARTDESAEKPGPVVIDAGRYHLGDNAGPGFNPEKPHGPAWAAKVPKLPALPDGCFYGLVAKVKHVVDWKHRDYEAGGYVDAVRVDGREVGRLNDHVENEDGPAHEIWVPLPGARWREGATLEIVAGQGPKGQEGNVDDFEVEAIRLAPMRRVEVRTGGPAKVVVAALDGAPLPRLGPDYATPVALRAGYTATGKLELHLPAAYRYRLTASRGPEFDVATAEVAAWDTKALELAPKRAVETPGMTAADFHLHADPSPDSRVKLPDRITSFLAEGLEFVVATDHNQATDYAPVIREMGVAGEIRSCVGDEITSREPRIGHFNAFPLDRVVDIKQMPPRALVERVDAQRPRARRVLQINHPRDGGIGYFNVFKFDPETASSPDPAFHLEFDAIEVFNGLEAWTQLDACLRDWFGLLNHGHRIVATGNSDSHSVAVQDAGWPRNFVITGKDGLPSEAEVVAAVKARRVVVSAGPIIEVVDAKGRTLVGSDLEATNGEVDLIVRVRSAPWIPIEKMRLVANGVTVETFEPKPETRLKLKPAEDTWYVVFAEGSRYGADVLLHDRVKPWAFTNPIWVDVDGGGFKPKAASAPLKPK